MRGTAQRHDSAVLSAPQDALRAESGPKEKGTLPPRVPGWAHPHGQGTSRGSSGWMMIVVGFFKAKCFRNCSKSKWEHEGTFLK